MEKAVKFRSGPLFLGIMGRAACAPCTELHSIPLQPPACLSLDLSQLEQSRAAVDFFSANCNLLVLWKLNETQCFFISKAGLANANTVVCLLPCKWRQ